MKLFYSPGACSLGIHALLEEIGKPFEPVLTNVREGANRAPAYLALNPKAKVPALQRDDGSILTEFPAIAVYLARTNPQANLLPADPETEARALEAMDYIVATVHMQGFTRIARPGNFTPTEADQEAVKARGREIFAAGMTLLDQALEGRDYYAGTRFSVADAALLFVENWAPRADFALPSNLAAHFARLKTRPSVQRAFATEGLAL
jgi:glutathione S-transferase